MEIKPFENKYASYLSDESHIVGHADFIAFPENESDLSEVFCFSSKNKMSVTVRGAGTGLSGGAIPNGGVIVSTEKIYGEPVIEKTDGGCVLSVRAGVTLRRVEEYLSRGEYRFAPNPTEKNATVGGLFVSNAMGLNVLQAGRVWEHIAYVRWVDREGKVRQAHAKTAVRELVGNIKNWGAAVDFGLKLTSKDGVFWGVVYFFNTEEAAKDFIGAVCARRKKSDFTRLTLAAFAYFNAETLKIISEIRSAVSALEALPQFPSRAGAAVYAELSGKDDAAVTEELYIHAELFEKCGGDASDTLAAYGEDGLRKFRDMCHATVEALNGAEKMRKRKCVFGYVGEDGDICEVK
ncbi:MAG: FAD-binding oxidoreductase [Clostridiales bacterium]|jgi:D-lactate dehydrogenase (cytochrome)|nr:FAD-binding oxidoreductase [Clostridiales bacterium]